MEKIINCPELKNAHFNHIVLAVVEALNARLCHDLSGPLAGVKAGVELLEDGNNEEVLALTLRSVEELSRQLKWLRSTFAGFLGTATTKTFSEAIRSVRESLIGGRIGLSEQIEKASKHFFSSHQNTEPIFANLFQLLSVDIRALLPLGGTVHADFSAHDQISCFRLKIEGPRVILREDWSRAIVGNSESLCERTVAAFIAAIYADHVGMKLALANPRTNVIEITATLGSRQ